MLEDSRDVLIDSAYLTVVLALEAPIRDLGGRLDLGEQGDDDAR